MKRKRDDEIIRGKKNIQLQNKITNKSEETRKSGKVATSEYKKQQQTKTEKEKENGTIEENELKQDAFQRADSLIDIILNYFRFTH